MRKSTQALWGVSALAVGLVTTLGASVAAPTTASAAPTQVVSSSPYAMADVSAGVFSSLGVNSAGEALSWGTEASTYPEPKDSTLVLSPTAVAGLANVKIRQVAAGFWHSVALAEDGSVYSWGRNTCGEVGNGSTQVQKTPTKLTGFGSDKIVQIAAGACYSLALSENGTVYSWGENGSGALGDGTLTDRPSPVKVQGLDNVTVTQISSQFDHSLAVSNDGKVFAWGMNADGQLGDDTRDSRSTPVRVKGLDDVTITRVSAGGSHSVALAQDGTVYSWGENDQGAVGDGTLTDRLSATRVPGFQASAVTAGMQHSVAIGTDNRVYSWGTNDMGQLGDGTTTSRNKPAKVPELASQTASKISAGGGHTLAIMGSGEVYAWGDNGLAQLGTGNRVTSTKPLKNYAPVENVVKLWSLKPSLVVGEKPTMWAKVQSPKAGEYPVAVEVWSGMMWTQVANGTTTSAGDIRMPFAYAASTPGTNTYRLRTTSDGTAQGTDVYSTTFTVVRHDTNVYAYSAAHTAKVGTNVNVYARVGNIGAGVTVRTQFWVNNAWSTSQVGTTDSLGHVTIPLTYGKTTVGTHSWRLHATNPYGHVTTSMTYTMKRTP